MMPHRRERMAVTTHGLPRDGAGRLRAPLRRSRGIVYGGPGRRSVMVRNLSILVAALITGSAAWAQGAPAESDDTRYSFNRADEGYLRLDGRTGQVSICTRRPVGWACQAVPDERTALEAEIARLQGENVALKKELLARNLPLPGTVKPEQPAAKPEEPRLQLPNDADLNKMMTFIEKIWRRLVDMVVTLQKDMLNKS
jgi:hypothetical protein